MTEFAEDLLSMVLIALLISFLARSAASSISVSHRRPWLRDTDRPVKEALGQ